MPSLNIFCFEFDRPGTVYTPGEIISGHVIIDLEREKIAEALKLSIKGEANVRWEESTSMTNSNENSTSSTITYWGNEKYFKFTILLLETTKGDGKVHIPAGLSRYPFCIQLPHEIPCSFEHRIGHIRYKIKAVIVRPWQFNYKCEVMLTIFRTYELNIRYEQCIGVHDEIKRPFTYLCCIDRGLIHMNVNLSKTGFVPGQWIETILNLRNTTIELQKICIKLQQSFKFCATAREKHVKETVAKVQKIGPFDKYAIIELRLLIPSVPPSELEFCNIIHLNYILRITLHNSKMFRKIVREYPILIGTIPP
ncbi:arrestin domain-containing protein 17 [Solenopsis invicta]|uniref:arrestin domain-containing protein 17 n=1 Tax=Solenopsis invicta TaxID=13686 RepID=UPI000595F5B5|nr:arrestin domain-containing protein 17 [Solenopsis invicta]